jgi:hypothetical protein
MKTKTSIYHRTFAFAYVLLVAVIFCGCGEQSQTETTKVKSINSLGNFPYNSNIDELTIVEIDDCEYIVCNAYQMKDITITHKGNCKFCAERSRK